MFGCLSIAIKNLLSMSWKGLPSEGLSPTLSSMGCPMEYLNDITVWLNMKRPL